MDTKWIGDALKIFTADLSRYLLAAGGSYLIFYALFKHPFYRFKIQKRYPDFWHLRREFLYSILSLLIFTCVGSATVYCIHKGYTQLYTKLGEHSTAYFILSTIGLIVLHDTYFYWTHRLIHLKWIYPYVHLVHHRSINPTPWAAYAFHPLEAIVQSGIFPLAVFLFPLHPLSLLVWGIYQIILNVGGHLGFEVFPKGFTTGKLSWWSNTSTHHNMHHRYVNCNYGLYFNIWDRLMGTNHPHYHTEFNRICEERDTAAH